MRLVEIYARPDGGSVEDLNIILRALDRRQESCNCESVLFQKPKGFQFASGGWIDIRFLSAELATGRTFSLASSPTESDLRITYKRGRSPFKVQLQNSRPGDIVLITQHGSNELVFDKSAPAVFIAGGVGIAPFRSILKEAVDYKERVPITLIYVDRADADFPFREEILGWRREWSELKTYFVATEREGRLTRERLEELIGADVQDTAVLTYVAGPPSMVKSTEVLLIQIGVTGDRIRKDQFDGYQ